MSVADLEPRTTLPPEDHTDVAALLHQLEADVDVAVLQAPDGRRLVLPPEVHAVLLDVTRAMSEGRAITVAPHEQVLSTQQAADLLGVSRPTFVAALERGELPYTQPGRHRRVRLTDVLEHQRRQRHERRLVLDSLSREAEALGIDDQPAPPQRIQPR